MLRSLLAAALCLSPAGHAQEPPRPNVIVFLADDLGWSDFGCYGGEIPTPHIDALAEGGLRFTQFYNTGRCCPTRASLLTGLYPHQAGVGAMTGDGGHPGYRGELNDECRTIAEVLRGAGYRTWMSGKWHVTGQTGHWDGSARRSTDDFPRQRGFERFFGTITGAGSFFQPITLMNDDTPVEPFPDALPEDFYYTTAIGEEAVRYISEHDQESPFFLYVAFTAPHWPLHAPEATITSQRGRYGDGWDAVREARHARQIEMGLVDPDWTLTERDKRVKSWEEAPNHAWEERRMEVYAAQVIELDREVGRVVATLRERGELENTLIFVIADNGGCAEELSESWRGLFLTDKTRDGSDVKRGNRPEFMPGGDDTYQSYGVPWANASNTPFRLYKHYNHEGGIASPCVVHWPAGIRPEHHGELRQDPAHLIDIMATCVDLAGATYPQKVGERDIQPYEGQSLAPTFEGQPFPERTLFWEHEGNRAVRRGRYKLVARGERGAWELYDLVSDRTEMRDLANEKPQLVVELSAEWDAWAVRARVVPPDRWRAFSDASEFELGPRGRLDRYDAPYIVGRDLIAEIEIAASGEGVLIAHGGSSHGWALWIEGGRLQAAVARDGRRHVVSGASLPTSPCTLTLELTAAGRLDVRHGEKSLLSGQLPGSLVAHPADGLQIGRDERGAVGTYEGPYPFTGELVGVKLRLR